MKLRQDLTVFQSHFNNIFLKSFRILQNLTRNCVILQLMRFYKTNDISRNFSGTTLGFHEVSKYFVDFQFHYWYFQKMTAKFWFLLNWFKISKFCTFRWRKLKRSISQLPSGSGSSWTRTLKHDEASDLPLCYPLWPSSYKWKGSNHKQSAWWQHASRLKASAFCIW
jgi:hypothetical protein